MSSGRDKRYRARAKAGVRVVLVELGPQITEAMVWRGLIGGAQRTDKSALAGAVGRILAAWGAGTAKKTDGPTAPDAETRRAISRF